ncbi:MAG: hypothetical protein ACM3N4_11665 [Nitrososphaerota archaeon]
MSSTTPTNKSAPDRSRRIAVIALLILVAITVVLAVVTGIYLFTRPSYAGAWVGPGVVQSTGDPNPIVVSLTLNQNPLGGISGSGTLCTTASDGALTRIPLTASGNLTGSSASVTLRATGGDTAIFPGTLTAQGELSQGQLTLSAESPAHLLLTLQPGSTSDFSAACDQLVQPTPGG